MLHHPRGVLVDNRLLRPAAVVAVGEGGPCQADGGEDNTGRAHGFGRADRFVRGSEVLGRKLRLNAPTTVDSDEEMEVLVKDGRCDQPLFDSIGFAIRDCSFLVWRRPLMVLSQLVIDQLDVCSWRR